LLRYYHTSKLTQGNEDPVGHKALGLCEKNNGCHNRQS
jgi:hypothetical protein